jgi:hypothetical protein
MTCTVQSTPSGSSRWFSLGRAVQGTVGQRYHGVAEKAMVDTFGDVLPPFADDGVYRHVRKFAEMLLLAKFEPHHELFVAEPLPGESAEDHADRLESVAEECRKKADALEAWRSKI